MRTGARRTVVVEWWRRWNAVSERRLRLRRTGAAALGVVVVLIAVAKLTWGTRGPGIATPFAYAALFFAALILFAVAIVSNEEFVDEMEASHPPRVRNRNGFVHNVKRFVRALSSFVGAVDATISRNVTRESVGRWSRAVADALSGVPPPDVSPTHAGPLARPLATPRPSRALGAHRRTPRRTLPVRGGALARLEALYRQRDPHDDRARHRERHPSASKQPAA